jgi:dolichol-phosphate mannosyltransferase
MRLTADGLLSIVVPVYNEEACLPELYARLARLPLPIEMIFVDDGSTDRSAEILRELAAADERVRVLGLATNGGSQRALLCGMRAARGDAICTMDADLQHPPELVPRMYETWRRGFAIVDMVRRRQPAVSLRDHVTPAFYRTFNLLSPVTLLPESTDFRLIDRASLWALRGFRGELLRAMVGRLEARRASLPFEVPPRFAGRSRYDLKKLCRQGWTAIVASTRARIQPPPKVAASAPDWEICEPLSPPGARSSASS